MKYRCPICQALLQIDGTLDFTAPNLQEITCPVCGAKLWIPGGFPIPTRWRVTKILEQSPQGDPQAWRRYVENLNPALTTQKITPQQAKSIYDPSNLFAPEVDFFKNLGQGTYKVGIWIVVILILVYLISRKFK